MNKKMTFEAKLMLKDEEDIFFGPGVANLLEAIDEMGNVKDAALSMGLSYTKAWTMLKNTKRGIGVDAVKRIKGGADGGSATLTEEGKNLLREYRAFEKKANKMLEAIFEKEFK